VEFHQQLLALAQIIFIDLVLAGDNAVVVGLAASRVEPRIRARVIFWGVAGAVILRVLFATVATQMLAIVGLTLAGGILLLWVCWRMYRDITGSKGHAAPEIEGNASARRAIFQILVADVSMSLDNVLAVAGAARDHLDVLVIGLLLSVGLMGAAANVIAKLLERYRWIAYIGLAIVVYVAAMMIWHGWDEVAKKIAS
jgi:YjbE family integral membrane protein